MSPEASFEIFVANLPRGITEEAVHKTFSKAGRITNVVVKQSSPPREPFALLTFTSKEDAMRAILTFNGKDIDRSTVAVNWSFQGRIEGSLPLGGVQDNDEEKTHDELEDGEETEYSTKEKEDLRHYLSYLESIEASPGKEKADVDDDPAPLQNIIVEENHAAAPHNRRKRMTSKSELEKKEPLRSNETRTQQSCERDRTLFVHTQNFETRIDISRDKIWKAFEAFGRVRRVDSIVNRGFAFVGFEDASSVRTALKKRHRWVYVDGVSLSYSACNSDPPSASSKSRKKRAAESKRPYIPARGQGQKEYRGRSRSHRHESSISERPSHRDYDYRPKFVPFDYAYTNSYHDSRNDSWSHGHERHYDEYSRRNESVSSAPSFPIPQMGIPSHAMGPMPYFMPNPFAPAYVFPSYELYQEFLRLKGAELQQSKDAERKY